MSDAQDESWSAFFGKTMLFPPIVAERRAYIVTLDSVLHAIEMPVGRKGRRCFVWTLYLSGAAQEQPQLKDVQLHVGVGGSPHE